MDGLERERGRRRMRSPSRNPSPPERPRTSIDTLDTQKDSATTHIFRIFGQKSQNRTGQDKLAGWRKSGFARVALSERRRPRSRPPPFRNPLLGPRVGARGAPSEEGI